MTWDTFPQELGIFAEALSRKSETEPTANGLWTLHGAFSSSWRRSRSLRSGGGIQIPVPRNKALHPKAAKMLEAEIDFVFELGDSIDSIPIPARSEFQVCIRGHVDYDGLIVELEDHWRVDTDARAVGTQPWEPHPKVHFQRGGHAQDRFTSNPGFLPSESLPPSNGNPWSSLFQSPGPRVPFPPFCPILAIDYVIGQHDGAVHRVLRSTPEYREVVIRAQRRLWTPFFEKLSSNANVRRIWLGDMLIEA